MSPKLDKSFHQPFYKEPQPLQKHPPHLKPPDEIKLEPPPHLAGHSFHPAEPQPLTPPPPDFKPPHLPHKKKKGLLIICLVIGTIFTIVIGLILNYCQISINVILPVLAPIWVGSITLIYTINKD